MNNTITDIFRLYGQEYCDRFGKNMPRVHTKALEAIISCRTSLRGTVTAHCTACKKQHVLFCACGNRHCPACQHHKARAWLARQIDRALPCNYFLLTFTVPEALRRVIRSHQRDGYDALFTASAHAIRTLTGDPRFCGGGQAGFTGVLHTWGRQLQFHPHVHYVVPGGTVIGNKERWEASPPGFFLPVRALSVIYKARFRDLMMRAGLMELIPENVWKDNWVVHSKPVGSAEHTLRYLARYVFKVAISNTRIVDVKDDMVTFRWMKKDSRRWRNTTISAMEFIRRYLQHVLPTGLVKVRHYGFLNHNSRILHKDLFLLVLLTQNFEGPPLPAAAADRPRPCCPVCGGPLKYICFSKPHLFERSVVQLT